MSAQAPKRLEFTARTQTRSVQALMACVAIHPRSATVLPRISTRNSSAEDSSRGLSGASTVSALSALGAPGDGLSPKAGEIEVAIDFSPTSMVEVIVKAVHSAIKPEWKPPRSNHVEQSGRTVETDMSDSDISVMRAVQAAVQSPSKCSDDQMTCPDADVLLSKAVEALAGIEEGQCPARDGPWAQLVSAITLNIVSLPMATLPRAAAEASKLPLDGGGLTKPQLALVRELLSNTIWDHVGAFGDALEEAGEATDGMVNTLRRISELTTTWSRAADIDRLSILAFVVSFACQCDDE